MSHGIRLCSHTECACARFLTQNRNYNSFLYLFQSFLHKKKQISFCRRPFAAICAQNPPDKQQTHMRMLQACCGFQVRVVSHMGVFTERLWHIQSLTSTHVQIHTHTYTPQGPWCIYVYMHLYVEFLVRAQEPYRVRLLTQLHARGATEVCAWTCLECPRTHVLLQIYRSSLQTFLDRQEKLHERRGVIHAEGQGVFPDPVPRCPGLRFSLSRVQERSLPRGDGFGVSQQTSPLYAELFQPGFFIQGVRFLHPWAAACDF